MLERETVTAASLDAAMSRAEMLAARLPSAETPADEPLREAAAPRTWKVGDRARSGSGGWEGRIAALEKGGRRATLEAGGLRVTVEVDDLQPALGVPTSVGGGTGRGGGAAAASNAATLRLERARTVASSLDLRGARVEEALETLDRYLDDAGVAGLGSATIIHGLGTGALRDAVRTAAASHPLVRSVRPGERGEGGDGATVVTL
jgi:DNA mismatch repair protein MutS2